jgi:hypothetical protein
LSRLDASSAKRIRFVLTDIDDTLTEKGKLLSASYDALWRLYESGIAVIPITGRPAGWCDLIAREWPVEGVVGENGALAFYEENGVLRRLFHPSVVSTAVRERLTEVRDTVLRRFPRARVAKDQPYRMFDLAIDFGEEEPNLGFAVADRIREVCQAMGANAKVSSIHVNAWFGEYDKLSMTLYYLRERFGIDSEGARTFAAFCGDSPNDEPMFSFFPVSCGVANVKEFADTMGSLPAYVTRLPGGRGFAEVAEELLRRREQ